MKHTAFRAPLDLLDELSVYSEDHEITVSEAIRQGLKLLLIK